MIHLELSLSKYEIDYVITQSSEIFINSHWLCVFVWRHGRIKKNNCLTVHSVTHTYAKTNANNCQIPIVSISRCGMEPLSMVAFTSFRFTMTFGRNVEMLPAIYLDMTQWLIDLSIFCDKLLFNFAFEWRKNGQNVRQT